MKNLSKKITGLVIAASIISTGVVAMAATAGTTSDSKTVNQSKAEGRMMKGEHRGKGGFDKGGFDKGGMVKGDIENNLKSLVSAGVITQDESDKILALSKEQTAARQAEMDKVKNMTAEERKAYFETAKDKSADRKGDIFAQAVTGGILTQEKADAAKAKLQETRTAERKAEVTEGLAGLVTAGTISQDQADKVAKYMETLQANKPAKDSTTAPDQKQERKNPLSALVDDGTLTQAQLDEVSKVVHFGGGHGHGGRGDKGFSKPASAPAADSSAAQSN
jgi:hypothetical protein